MLYIYLSVSKTAVNSVLIFRVAEAKELPVFYVAKSLLDDESRYPLVEQLGIALISSARRL